MATPREREIELRERIYSFIAQEILPVRWCEIRDCAGSSRSASEIDEAVGNLSLMGLIARIDQFFPSPAGKTNFTKLKKESCFLLPSRLPEPMKSEFEPPAIYRRAREAFRARMSKSLSLR